MKIVLAFCGAVWLGGAAEAAEMPETDIPTVMAIGATTYLVTGLIHEGAGHLGACGIVGGTAMGMSTGVADCDWSDVGLGGRRTVALGGVAANLTFSLSTMTSLLVNPPKNSREYFALWLFTSINLLQGVGYPLVSVWTPIGDFSTNAALEGVKNPLPWQISLSLASGGLLFASIPLMHQLGKPLFGDDKSYRRRLFLLTVVPYLTGSTLLTLSGLLFRDTPLMAISTGVANFAGTLFLAYLPLFFYDDFWIPGKKWTEPAKPIRRSVPWLVVGSVAVVSALTIFGPGVGKFDNPHPLDPTKW